MEIEDKKKLYLKLFTSTFYLSAFTFGGGYVIVPLMKKKFSEEYKWIDEDEILDLVAIAQSAPGVIAINSSIILGYRLAGIFGAVIAVTATVLPPLIIISIISLFYIAFRDNIIVNTVLKGMQAGVAAVIADVVFSMASKIIKAKELLPIMTMIIVFIASYFFKVNLVLIIFLCGAIGAFHRGRVEKNGGDKK